MIPDLVCMGIEQLGLVCRPKVVDRVEVFEHSPRDDGAGLGPEVERVCADGDGAAEIDGLASFPVRD
jgi:hypothetical protein